MKPILMLLAVATLLPATSTVGCEGEPPVVATGNAPGVAAMSAEQAETPAAPTSEAVAAPPPSASACPPPPCSPTGPAPLASGSAVPSASAAPADSTAALPVPPPSVTRGNIVGTVTTHPGALQSQVVVYLEDGPQEDAPARLQTVTIANKQMNFLPYISVVAVGGKVVFANEDPFPHNVFSPDGEKFNMGNIPQNGAHVRVFKNTGVYSLLCNLHPGMLGYLVVTPSTWAARGDGKGKFAMKHVPAGTYKVTAWAPRLATSTSSVTVSDGDVTVDFDLHR